MFTGQWEYLSDYDCYCMKDVCYCEKPLDREKQALHIYVPAIYMHADGSMKKEATLITKNQKSYTAATVPVIYYNDVGGYAECKPAELKERNLRYLEAGYVLVSAGARGRQTADAAGHWIGKAPQALVDLKAGIRFLRRHRNELPGDYDRIISVGTSAGGALSALLAVSGNNANYQEALMEIGAAMEQRDDIFAAQCYCPILDLEHADMAYEWMFQSKNIYTLHTNMEPQLLNTFEQALSKDLAQQFPAYINGLDLGLELTQDGRGGSYYDSLMEELGKALNLFLDQQAQTEEEKRSILEELNAGARLFLWDEARKQAYIEDLDLYVRAVIDRKKGCPAFDGLVKMTPENELFGAEDTQYMHFNQRLAALFETGKYDTLSGFQQIWKKQLKDEAEDAALQRRVYLMNPMNYVGGQEQSDYAPHVRIRLGSKDADTSFAIAFSFAKLLERRTNVKVDYGMVWGLGHCDADQAGQFSAWVDHII